MKYRIEERRYNGHVSFYPQWTEIVWPRIIANLVDDWWSNFRDPIWGVDAVFKTMADAEEFLSRHIDRVNKNKLRDKSNRSVYHKYP